jgi:hypothetical protein
VQYTLGFGPEDRESVRFGEILVQYSEYKKTEREKRGIEPGLCAPSGGIHISVSWRRPDQLRTGMGGWHIRTSQHIQSCFRPNGVSTEHEFCELNHDSDIGNNRHTLLSQLICPSNGVRGAEQKGMLPTYQSFKNSASPVAFHFADESCTLVANLAGPPYKAVDPTIVRCIT